MRRLKSTIYNRTPEYTQKYTENLRRKKLENELTQTIHMSKLCQWIIYISFVTLTDFVLIFQQFFPLELNRSFVYLFKQ